ncbi:MAG TPA: nuclear transport factor 2 family protein [Gemmatimonadales bacterium]
MGRSSVATVLAAALAAACVTHRTVLTPHATVRGTPEIIDGIVRAALQLDAALNRAADTLYATDALVVANAQVRLSAPRFAGVTYGGRMTVAAAAVTLEGRFAWALVDYRWIGARQAEAGRATFILEDRPGGWRIIHVHSSQLLPWDR